MFGPILALLARREQRFKLVRNGMNMKAFLVLLIGILPTTFTHAAQPERTTSNSNLSPYVYSAMVSFMSSLRGLKSLPAREADSSLIEAGTDAISKETSEVFESVQSTVFLKPLIQLKPCFDCWALADYASKTIYVQPSFVQSLLNHYGEKDGLWLIEFIFAHEISHFIHELSIGRGSKTTLSIHGNQSLFVRDSTYEDSAEAGRRSHAEVDAYAFIIMKKLNKVSPRLLIPRWFEDTVEEIKTFGNPDLQVVLDDFANRSKSADLVIKDLWPH